MLEDYTRRLAGGLGQQYEAELRNLLDSECPGWTLEIAKARCHISREPSGVEVFYLDGRPLMEFHPIEIETEQSEEGWRVVATRRFRDLRPTSATHPER